MNKPLLGLALVVTVLAAWLAPQEEDSEVAAAVAVKRPPPSAAGNSAAPASAAALKAASGGFDLRILPRQFEAGPAADKGEAEVKGNPNPADAKTASAWGGSLFALTNWNPPPPPPAPAPKQVKAPPPPPPTAPPLPFRYMGRWVEDGKTHYFMQYNGRDLVLLPGMQIDPQYKLESVQGGQMRFTYLPLQQQQTLAVGEVN